MKQFDWTRLLTRPYKVYAQLVLWSIIFFLYILLKEYPQRMHGATLACLVLQEMLELAIPCYTQNLLVLPLLKRRQWTLGISAYLLQLLILISGLPYLLNATGRLFALLFHVTDLVDWRQEHIAFSIVAFTIIATLTKSGLDRIVRDKTRKENELLHLKAQLNPHFLFNTLNNLYGLSVTGSARLPELMLKLSDLLRYSLYDTGQHYVALQKETDYISNYVALERLRLNDGTDIRLELEDDAITHYIAPLLLIVFIENAFKHYSVTKGEQAFIHISLAVKDDVLRMQVKNSIDPGLAAAAPPPKRRGGLGLENARQRLQLMYQGLHTLRINKGHNYFETDLTIELK